MNTKHSALGFFGTWGAILAVFALAVPNLAGAQENAIETIDVSPQQAGRTTVRVTLKAPPAAPPAGFSIANPPRIAFDFPNTTNASGRNVQDVSGGDLRRINVVQASGRIAEITRSDVAFNFAPLFTKDVALDGDVVAMATGLTARLENHTGLAAALESAKLTPREYSKFAIALVAAHLANGFMKAGVLQRVPEGAPTNNVEFVKAHEVEINDVLAQLGIRD